MDPPKGGLISNMDKKYFIIDFDSTFIKTEGLDELAKITLEKDPQKDEKIKKIQEITSLGMEGKISYDKSLKQRIKLLTIDKEDIVRLSKKLSKKVSDSIRRNKQFFKKYQYQIYIISGGFKEYILPVVEKYHILENHVFANTFHFNNKDKVIGYDTKNPLSQKGGKIKVVKELNLKGEIFVIGDGYTDYQLKEIGIAQNFTAFIENAQRNSIIDKADEVAPTFDEFLYSHHLPASISYPKNRIKVALLENIDNEAVKKFEKEGYSVEYYERALSRDELLKKISQVKILGIRSRTELSQEILIRSHKLLTIGAFCIGTNQVDLKTATDLGIAVFNAPYSNTRSVVELILGEIIMLSRNIIPKNLKLHQGEWDKSSKDSHEIRGKTLGIVGYGNIGSQLSTLAETMGMNVFFYDIMEKLAFGNAKKCNSLKELLKKSDIVTVHVDGSPLNKNLIGNKEFNQMKPGVVFLNASRGFVVDIQALVKHIKLGRIKGAAIDVFPNEPRNSQKKFLNPLRNLPNVILTPHIGGSTIEAQKNIAVFVTEKIIDYINTGCTYLSVNLPNIQYPLFKNANRLLHIHKNVPGILSKINSILARNSINILGQYLKTNEEIGYVITDVNKRYDQKIMEELKLIPDTIRFRVLY